MSFLLFKKYRQFTLSMLKEGQLISRRQYESLYKEIGMFFSIHSHIRDGNRFCKIKREYELKERDLFGQIISCPMPTSNNETFSFYVEGTEFLQ